ncbi:AbrB/MazE/SpoVT family DNA-binding domain-containing protein [Niveispirillum sp.]|uniref:AbrB/MazE/SpoVT family DNA-binding domain-containing protein n=1 Tax=Niveispirillum sp. TaxID=1917217 RepID=UPI001B54F575|nr:AbrB/MazE/SpoVT family DNA-binding domain-containing protein [Niveispirillum sp.]MBP7339908.1 AbrB/MazE/SpoVT family DNA-binding domain-containing protein [Niveispirillum sp.]
MDLIIGPDGAITLTAEMLEHLGLKPGDRLSAVLAAGHRVELAPPARAPGEKLLKSMLGRTAKG